MAEKKAAKKAAPKVKKLQTKGAGENAVLIMGPYQGTHGKIAKSTQEVVQDGEMGPHKYARNGIVLDDGRVELEWRGPDDSDN
jgi:hypothetical protein